MQHVNDYPVTFVTGTLMLRGFVEVVLMEFCFYCPWSYQAELILGSDA